MNEYIKREDAIGAILDKYVDYAGITDEIKAVPSADVVEVRHGHWIEYDDITISCECSVCGEKFNLYEDDVFGYPYCPNCGAKMDGKEQEHE